MRSGLRFCLRRHLLAAALTSAIAVAPGSVLAEVRAPTPAGWVADAAAPRPALAEADAWASATGLEVTQIAAPDEDDAFVESLVVLHDRRPLHPDALADETVALSILDELALQIFEPPDPATSHALVSVGDSVVLQARWQVGAATWDLVLAPAGAEHALIVLKTRSAAASLRGDLIDEVVSELEGVSAPIAAFPLATFRALLIGFSLGLGVIAHLLMLSMGPLRGDHLGASRRSSLVMVILTLLATGIVYASLGDSALPLSLAGTSRMGVALETLGAGMAIAILLSLLGRVMGGRPTRVDSAPKTGAFSPDAPPPLEPRPDRPADRPGSPVPRTLGATADADVGQMHRDDPS